MMSLLARFDPGDGATGQSLIVCLAQTSVVIVMAALWGHTLFRRRPEARHALWLSRVDHGSDKSGHRGGGSSIRRRALRRSALHCHGAGRKVTPKKLNV